jgi:hypothetical protein
VFVELAFHCIRQEKYPAALGWISTVIELCPGVVEQLDDVLNRTTAVSQLPTTLGGLQPVGDESALNGLNAGLFSSLFFRGHLKQAKKQDRAVTAPDGLGGSRVAQKSTPEERRAAIERALAGSSKHFVTPGPGHYDIEPGMRGSTRLILYSAAIGVRMHHCRNRKTSRFIAQNCTNIHVRRQSEASTATP